MKSCCMVLGDSYSSSSGDSGSCGSSSSGSCGSGVNSGLSPPLP